MLRFLMTLLLSVALPWVAGASEAVPPLSETVSIDISVNGSDSGAYLTITPMGVLVYHPWRTAMMQEPEGTYRTAGPVVSYVDIYNKLAPLVLTAEQREAKGSSADDRLIYFNRVGSGEGVYLPGEHKHLADELFALAANSPHLDTPSMRRLDE